MTYGGSIYLSLVLVSTTPLLFCGCNLVVNNGGGESGVASNESSQNDSCTTKRSSTRLRLLDEVQTVSNDSAQIGALNFGSAVLDELHSNLLAAGLSDSKANVIGFVAAEQLKVAIGTLTVDTSADGSPTPAAVLAMPPAIKGAMFALNDPCTDMGNAAERTFAAKLIMNSTTGSLNGRTSELDKRGTQNLVGKMVLTGVQSLSGAGLAGDLAGDGLTAVTSGTVGALTKSGVSAAQIGDFAKAIANQAVSGMRDLGTSADKVGALAGAVASAAIQGLSDAGLSAEEIIASKAIGQIVSGAASAVIDAGASADQSAAIVGNIAGAAIVAFASTSISSLEMKMSALADVVAGSMEAAGALNPGKSAEIAEAMSAVANEAVSALVNGGLSSGDLETATATIVETGISKILSIGITDAATAMAISAKIIEGTSAGIASLQQSGKVDASDLVEATSSLSAGAVRALVVLQDAGVVSSGSQFEQFTQQISESVSDGLTSGGASADVVATAHSAASSEVEQTVQEVATTSPTATVTTTTVPSGPACDPDLAGKNLMNSYLSGGTARVVEMSGANNAGPYQNDLTVGCDDVWFPQGSLCDQGTTVDSPWISSKVKAMSGATWSSGAGTGDSSSTGILVVDLGATRTFNSFRVFQMSGDGYVTHFRMFVHPSTDGASYPPADDNQWGTAVTPGGGFVSLGQGYYDADTDPNFGQMMDPASVNLATKVTGRYVKIEVQNRKIYDPDGWIELRSVKLFCDPSSTAPTIASFPTSLDFRPDALTSSNGTVAWTDSNASKSVIPTVLNTSTAGLPGFVAAESGISGHKAASFDGTGYLKVKGIDSPVSRATSFTVAAVFEPSQAGNGGAGQWYNNSGIVDSEQGGSTTDWGLTFTSGSQVGAGVGQPDTTVYSSAVALNAPHFAAYTWDSATRRITLTVDGQVYRKSQAGSSTLRPRTLNRFLIGSMNGLSSTTLRGKIAHVQVYNHALTDTELFALNATFGTDYSISMLPSTGLVSTASVTSSGATISWESGRSYTATTGSLQYKAVIASSSAAIDTGSEINDTSSGVLQDWDDDVSSAAASGLTASTTYYVNVAYKDPDGNISVGTPVSFVTEAP